MGFFDFLKPKKAKPIVVKLPKLGARARQSIDSASDLPFFNTFFIEAPPDALNDWRLLDLNDSTLSRISPARLVELMADVSPEVSRALWDFARFCNPGYEVAALQVDSEDEDSQGQAALADIFQTLKDLYGAADVVFNRLFMAAFLRGAFLAELVIDEDGRAFADLATPDPYSVRFQKIRDEVRGNIWQMGQFQGSEWVVLEDETIKYVPVDPLPGKPHGRSLVAPAIFSALFLIGLMHDLRRVVAQQGYPRIDVEVSMEKLVASMPEEIKNDPDLYFEQLKSWAEAAINEVKTVYASLEPDDAYIHSDMIRINRPVGTVDASSLGAIDQLIRGIERMAIRGLKTIPLLFGSNEAVSETHANRQWEIHATGIRSIQHLCENLLEHLLGLALEAQGIQATVKFRFAELRASEALRDAQTETILIANAVAKYAAGWVSQDAASMEVTGSPADVPAPRLVEGGGMPQVGGAIDGLERGRWLKQPRRAVQIVPNGSENPLPPEPGEVQLDNDDGS